MNSARTAALGLLLPLAGCAGLPGKDAGAVIDRWSRPSADAARSLILRYGPPDETAPDKLTWRGKGSWLRTVVWNRHGLYRSPRDFDLVIQTVKYPVTRGQAAELVAFSDALVVNVDRGELSSRASREELNRLNLNLADEVARGIKSVEEARAAYQRALRLSAAGKSSPYMAGLLFTAGESPNKTILKDSL